MRWRQIWYGHKLYGESKEKLSGKRFMFAIAKLLRIVSGGWASFAHFSLCGAGCAVKPWCYYHYGTMMEMPKYAEVCVYQCKHRRWSAAIFSSPHLSLYHEQCRRSRTRWSRYQQQDIRLGDSKISHPAIWPIVGDMRNILPMICRFWYLSQ